MKRRLFMKGTLAGSAITAALGAGLLAPRAVLAAWPEAEMLAADVADTGMASGSVKIKAPEIAENGAVVPVTVDATGVDGIVESISIVAAANQRPLGATYHMKEGAIPFVSTRLKMGKTGDVFGVVKTASGTVNAKTQVKVTIGGCGG
ncbi:MAG: thiosulfate oxidation carrier protein SoxY [Gammaproteobacteria bacterium]|mgnify:CR=1 FL=1|jgi:sulfur-oxidizing protein SoxY|nr:thiosulfate oxidation carrier protein SoxY [Gammaproteobacteria bacterium]MBT4606373.1 thiosulfate oxidation carrier protein SoxY [Thiotrichales bacterium]MBT3472697.1 thiosulfate oxidation carrier protein SoxY [Gammaproteobacteria bacterium]MBT3967362.1 thiosulfate oxidation carrier protein SoxY [Gammaproteobacteria bacterium]MBT4081499.1 thiosulfate oxidation carrier protein SoxY [Gammaproteobacteria bacterium]